MYHILGPMRKNPLHSSSAGRGARNFPDIPGLTSLMWPYTDGSVHPKPSICKRSNA